MVAGQVLTLEMEVRLLPPQPKKEQAPVRPVLMGSFKYPFDKVHNCDCRN